MEGCFFIYTMIIKLPLNIVLIEEDGFHLSINMSLNNKPANILIDTGASRTVFDKNRILNFVEPQEFLLHEKVSTGLGTSTMQSHKIIIHELSIGSQTLVDYEAVLLDMTHVNQSYEQLELAAIDGVLGGDLLMKFNAVIDYGNKEIIFHI